MQQTTHNPLPRPAARRGGFTLIELLVVIGIIVLLVSLVLAVSGSVIRSSEERATRNTLEVLNAATEEFERVLDRRISYQSGVVTSGIAADPAPSATAVYDILSSYAAATSIPPGSPGNGVTGWTQLSQPYSTLPPNGLPGYSLQPFRRAATLLWVMSQSQSVGPILQKLPESVFRSINIGTGQQTSLLRHCVDSWGTPIIAVFPGREATQAELDANNANVIDRDGTVKSDSEWQSAANGGLRVSCKDRRILWVSAGNDTRFSDLPVSGVSNPSADNLYSYEP
jgi:prepilin-type N-terminal cleavage/methylation domain-containing protein